MRGLRHSAQHPQVVHTERWGAHVQGKSSPNQFVRFFLRKEKKCYAILFPPAGTGLFEIS